MGRYTPTLAGDYNFYNYIITIILPAGVEKGISNAWIRGGSSDPFTVA